MSTQSAIQIESTGVAKLVQNAPVPTLRDDYILVKTAAVALNPTDWKHIDFLASKGAIVGCDYSGVVEKVGPAVTNSLKPGDKVAGFIHGSNSDNHEDGAFAEHIAAKGDLQIKIPDNLSFEEAATLGVGITTVGQGLYQSLGLPLPTQPSQTPFPILILGGSTATGTLAIQYAKLSGLQVITTCSPSNFELVRSRGADHVFDYRDSAAPKAIRELTDDKLRYAFDTISSTDTAKFASESLGTGPGGKYSSLMPIADFPRKDVSNSGTLAYTAIGETFHKRGKEFPASAKDYEFAVEFWKLAGKLLEQGKMKVHPQTIRSTGLEGVLEGVDELRQDKVSGTKIVYTL
ncbi:oxidoreductase-like protein [Xylona heveae TC161]|uniref:Oxidoreductase-like protein n=1 Tax=Xylona heveae (strain CBS 132557 / TC161) TaxID=1328760 RepID=A0A165AAL0_XYLHT|nr:oxidoreductase-like protein [Xylona heveae TC161]KZF20177.1 oxidoreductase-like protein [Xylona heveae TC161]